MTKLFSKNYPTVFTDDHGQHLVMLPSGDVLPSVVKTVVVDDCDAPALARVTFYVNLAKDKEDALAIYKKGG